jgi:hypothetical protein
VIQGPNRNGSFALAAAHDAAVQMVDTSVGHGACIVGNIWAFHQARIYSNLLRAYGSTPLNKGSGLLQFFAEGLETRIEMI